MCNVDKANLIIISNDLLVQFACFERAGVIVERLVGHVLVHQVRQPQLRQDPLRPVARWVRVSLATNINGEEG